MEQFPKFANAIRKEYNAYCQKNRNEGRNFEFHYRYLNVGSDAFCILPSLSGNIYILSFSFNGLTYGKNELLKAIRDNKLPNELEINKSFSKNNSLRIANIFQNPYPHKQLFSSREEFLNFRFNVSLNNKTINDMLSLSRALNQLSFNAVSLPVDPKGQLLLPGSDAAFVTFSECMMRNGIKIFLSFNLQTLTNYNEQIQDFIKRHDKYLFGIIVEASSVFNNDKRNLRLMGENDNNSSNRQATDQEDNANNTSDGPDGKHEPKSENKNNSAYQITKGLADKTHLIWRDERSSKKYSGLEDMLKVEYVKYNNMAGKKYFYRHFIAYTSLTWQTQEEYDTKKNILLYFHTEEGDNLFRSIQTN